MTVCECVIAIKLLVDDDALMGSCTCGWTASGGVSTLHVDRN